MVTVVLSRTIDALDNWCLRRVLNIHWSEFVTNDEIRSRTGQPFLSDTVRSRSLSFIGHLYCADPRQDCHRALQACIADPPDNWRRRIGRPRQSWLRTVEADLQPMNLGLATAKWRAQDRSAWRKLVATATSSQIRSWRRRSRLIDNGLLRAGSQDFSIRRRFKLSTSFTGSGIHATVHNPKCSSWIVWCMVALFFWLKIRSLTLQTFASVRAVLGVPLYRSRLDPPYSFH